MTCVMGTTQTGNRAGAPSILIRFDFDWWVHDFGFDFARFPTQLNHQSAVNSHSIIAAVIVI